MVFGLFTKKDPVCGMKKVAGKGTEKHGQWFCSPNCLKEFEKSERSTASTKKGCCH